MRTPAPIKIGFLSPYSTIYPDMGNNMVDGIYCGLPEKLHPYIQIIPEFVQQGQPSALKPAITKLISFDRVNILTGLVGFRSISDLIPQIENSNTVGLFAEMGEYLPPLGHKSNSIFFNSFQYWQAEFALGAWAQEKFRGKGSVFMPIYDGGYHMHSAFRLGTQAVEPAPIDYATMRYSQGADYSVREVFEEYMLKYKKERPQYVHALFSGSEAVEFFTIWHKSGLHKEIPLIVSPHMASQEILEQVKHLDMSFYSASLWDVNSEGPINKNFRQKYTHMFGGTPNIFALLGYEIGLALEVLYPSLIKKDLQETIRLLKNTNFRTPRGERNFDFQSATGKKIIDIEQISLANNQVHKITIAQGNAMPYDHTYFHEIHHENLTGWLNGYLCV